MEKLQENFFKDLITKIKSVFNTPTTNNEDQPRFSPEEELLEEIISHLSLVDYEIKQYLTSHIVREGFNTDGSIDYNNDNSEIKFNKMESVNKLIQDMLNLLKEYKEKTNNKIIYKKIYELIISPLFHIKKETPIIEYEKLIIDLSKKILKIANYAHNKKDLGIIEDDIIAAHESFFRMFSHFPTDNYHLLRELIKGNRSISIKDIAKFGIDYEKNAKTQFNLLKQKSKNEYDIEWEQNDNDAEFEKFLKLKMKKDFDKLWDEKFEKLWLKDHATEISSQRQEVSHLKESHKYKIIEIFTKE